MDEQRTFVGRKAELDRLREVVEDPRGQAIVVVGQAGMGKTWLIDRMTQLATEHRALKCGWVRYEVTPTDSPDSTMELMMDNAFEAARATEDSFDKTDRRKAQWAALFKTFVPKGSDILELLASLRRDPQKHTREQFIDRLHLISRRMGPDGRALFVIDPEKLMCPGCADSWRLVTRDLPEKVKFLFAQRPEDELINNNAFMALDNVIRLPDAPLGVLSPEDVEELVRLQADEIGQSGQTLRDAMAGYRGHPYAIQAAMEIIRNTRRIEDLPQDPTLEKIAAVQWKQVCRTGENAIRLFEAYAILEVAVRPDVVQTVSGLDVVAMKQLLSDTYLFGLLRQEGQGSRIYHALLADHVRSQIDQDGQRDLHASAILLFRTRLKEAGEQYRMPDALAAVRLPEHVLVAEGPHAFLVTFVNECTKPLVSLGLLDAAINFSLRSLELVQKGTKEEANIVGNVGVIWQTCGDLQVAEKMHKKALEINRKLGRLEGMANDYGNLAVVYQLRGDLDKAEKTINKALEIDLKLGRLEGMASEYGNLGLLQQRRGDLNMAEKMLKRALEIELKLGRLEDVARAYASLGIIHQERGDLDEAETMHNKALEINQRLGRLEGIASDYGNLGLIYRTRGDLDKAESVLNRALELHEKAGHFGGAANALGNLGMLHQRRGDLDKAESVLKKALEIYNGLGQLDGVARAHGGLAIVYRQRGDDIRAHDHMEKASVLFQKIEGKSQR